MPIVPRVNPTPLPDVRLTAEPLQRMVPEGAFGGGQGNVSAGIDGSLSAVHAQAAQIQQEEQQKANQIASTGDAAQIAALATDGLYGPDGALTKQGQDAFSAPETMRANFFGAVGQIRSKITDPDRLQRFDGTVARTWSTMNEQAQRHVAGERQRYDTSQTGAAVDNLTNLALQGYNDPATVANSIDQIRALRQAYGARNGWSPDETKEITDAGVSAVHQGVLSRMLDNQQDTAASAYYDAHKDEIEGPAQAKIEAALAVSSTQGEAQRLVNTVLAPKPDGSSVSAADAFTQVESATADDPKLHKEALQLVTSHFNELNAAQRIDRENAQARVIQNAEGNNNIINKASPDWQLIDGHPEGRQVEEWQRQKLHPPRDPGDPDKYQGYLAMAATSPATQQQLLATDPKSIIHDPTMNSSQKDAVINLIKGERQRAQTAALSDLQHESQLAEADVKAHAKALDEASGDDERQAAQGALLASQARAKDLQGQLQQARRTASLESVPSTMPSAGASGTRGSSGDIGLSTSAAPLKPLTPAIVNDIRRGGLAYAQFVARSGYAVPTELMNEVSKHASLMDVFQPAPKK